MVRGIAKKMVRETRRGDLEDDSDGGIEGDEQREQLNDEGEIFYYKDNGDHCQRE
jgi:hypothetical protein